MKDNLERVRDLIQEAKSEGHRKENIVIIAGDACLKDLRAEVNTFSQYDVTDVSHPSMIDGVPIARKESLDSDEVLLVADSNSELSLSDLF